MYYRLLTPLGIHMAFRVSKTYGVGTILGQRTSRIYASQIFTAHSSLARRNVSTTKVKPPPKTQDVFTNKARKNVVSEQVHRPAASASQARKAAGTRDTASTASTTRSGFGEKKYADMSEEEKEREIQRLLQMSELMPTVDPFGQEIVDTLDVMIPYPSEKSLSFSKKKFDHLKSNFSNFCKNAMALDMLSDFNAIPGIMIRNGRPLLARVLHKFKLFGTHSTEPDGLMAPFRQFAIDQYEQLNSAVASRNERHVRKLTTWKYQTQTLDLVKNSLKICPNGRVIWQLHRIIEPVQVLSLRATYGYLEEQNPKIGNRLLVHALVKFDTEQSLEIYDSHGKALHSPAAPEKNKILIDAQKELEKWRVPAQKRHVKEYLVLEKRMWTHGPWVFREQMWPTVEPSKSSE